MSTDAVIIGGGVIGLSIARELAGRGLSVVVLDGGPASGRASPAAAGMLAPRMEATILGSQVNLGVASAAAYGSWIAAIEEETGDGLDYRTIGLVSPFRAHEAAQAAAARDLEKVELLTEAEVYERIRDLGPGYAGALWYPDDHVIDPRLLLDGLRRCVTLRGVAVEADEAARAVRYGKDGVEGVERTSGRFLPAAVVVNAAGTWAGRIPGGGLDESALVPVRGQMLRLDPGHHVLPHGVHGTGCYVLPRRGGEWVAGATVERVGFECEVTAGGLAEILEGLFALFPAARKMPVRETWAGLRPGTPDGLPYLGPVKDIPGLFVAAGHFRNGILLAPITAEIVADCVTTGEPRFDLTPFAPQRAAGYNARQH